LLLVGDYVRPGVQGITSYLQGHAGLGFAFGLIEMAVYRRQGTAGPYYLQPRVIAQTEIITRTVFLAAPDSTAPRIAEVELPKKPSTLTEQEFFAELEKVDPAYPEQLREFFARCNDRGCLPILRKRYVLYVEDPTGSRINLGTIDKSGAVELWGMAARDAELGEPVGRRYLEEVAALVPGATVKDDLAGVANWHLVHAGRASIPLREMLERQEGWLAAISKVVDRFAELSRRQVDQ